MTSPSSDAHQAVYAVDADRIAAMVDGDFDALGRLIDDDCCYVHSSASVDTKDSYLQRLRNGEIVYKRLSTSDQSIIDLGDAFAVPHLMEGDIAFSGVDRAYLSRAVAIWRTTEEGLRLVYFQATAVPR